MAALRSTARPAGPNHAIKVSPNDYCPCGSGKKYKSCCLNASDPSQAMGQATPAVHNFSNQILEFWPTIAQAWNEHCAKRPVIELDLDDGVVKVWPAHAYIENLIDDEKGRTRDQFDQLLDQGGIMVFIKGRKKRILQTFQIAAADIDELNQLHRTRMQLSKKS